MYIIIYTATGDIFDHIFDFLVEYFPSKEEEVEDIREYYYGLCLRLRRFLGYDEHRSSSDKQESMHVSSGNRSSKDSQSNLSERQEISTNVEEGKADISEASNIRPLSRKASVSRLEKSRSQSYAVDFDLSFRNEDDDGSTANPITTPYVDFTFEQDPTRPQDDAVSRPSSKD